MVRGLGVGGLRGLQHILNICALQAEYCQLIAPKDKSGVCVCVWICCIRLTHQELGPALSAQ